MCWQGLLVVYLVVVVVLVKRQIRLVEDEEDYIDREELVIVTDKKGSTDAKPIDNIVMKENEIFL